MQETTTVQLTVLGDFRSGEYTDWVRHRANILDLTGWINTRDNNFVEIEICGNPILVEAFELACSIGPYSVTVRDIQVRTVSNGPYSCSAFEVR